MEIEGKNGWRTELRKGSMEFGRGLGFPTADRTVSRRHVSFELLEGSETRVRFEVIGKNPIWVLSSRSGDIKVFGRHERGEMESGGSFCVSSKNPIWFSLKKIEFPEMGRCGFESLSVSDIDPVKEFGFIVMGHEFDSYPKRMIRDIKSWNWFLEEPCKDSEDDEVFEKKKRGTMGKRKQAEDSYDDDWMGESDEDKHIVAKIGKNQRPRYSTRSKDYNKTLNNTVSSKNSMKNANGDDNEYEDEGNDETEDEDTLGGFIVKDNEEEDGEEIDYDDEEEEEEDYGEDDEEMDE